MPIMDRVAFLVGFVIVISVNKKGYRALIVQEYFMRQSSITE